MRTQTKNKIVGILLIPVLTACVFLTMIPIAQAEEPPVPQLYEEGDVTEEATSELPSEVVPISAEEQATTQHEEELEIVPIAADEPVPVLISEDEPQPVLIAQPPQAASKALSTWGWIIIIAAGASVVVLIAVGVVTGKRKKAAAK